MAEIKYVGTPDRYVNGTLVKGTGVTRVDSSQRQTTVSIPQKIIKAVTSKVISNINIETPKVATTPESSSEVIKPNVYYSSNPTWKPEDKNAVVIYTDKSGVTTGQTTLGRDTIERGVDTRQEGLNQEGQRTTTGSELAKGITLTKTTSYQNQDQNKYQTNALRELIKPPQNALTRIMSFIVKSPEPKIATSYSVPQRVTSGGESYTTPQMPVVRYADVTSAVEDIAKGVGDTSKSFIETVGFKGVTINSEMPSRSIPLRQTYVKDLPLSQGGTYLPKQEVQVYTTPDIPKTLETGTKLGAYFVPYLGEELLAEQFFKDIPKAADTSRTPLERLSSGALAVGSAGLLGSQVLKIGREIKTAREFDLFNKAPIKLAEREGLPLSELNMIDNTLYLKATKQTQPKVIDTILGIKPSTYYLESKVPFKTIIEERPSNLIRFDNTPEPGSAQKLIDEVQGFRKEDVLTKLPESNLNRVTFEGGEGSIRRNTGLRKGEITTFDIGGRGESINTVPRLVNKKLKQSIDLPGFESSISRTFTKTTGKGSLKVSNKASNIIVDVKGTKINAPKTFDSYFGISTQEDNIINIIGGKVERARLQKYEDVLSISGKPNEYGRLKIVTKDEDVFTILPNQGLKANLPEALDISYHGTDSLSAERILKEGLKSGKETQLSNRFNGLKLEGAYTTPDINWAKSWANMKVYGRGTQQGTPKVLEISIPKSEVDKLLIRTSVEKGGGPELIFREVPPQYIKEVNLDNKEVSNLLTKQIPKTSDLSLKVSSNVPSLLESGFKSIAPKITKSSSIGISSSIYTGKGLYERTTSENVLSIPKENTIRRESLGLSVSEKLGVSNKVELKSLSLSKSKESSSLFNPQVSNVKLDEALKLGQTQKLEQGLKTKQVNTVINIVPNFQIPRIKVPNFKLPKMPK